MYDEQELDRLKALRDEAYNTMVRNGFIEDIARDNLGAAREQTKAAGDKWLELSKQVNEQMGAFK